MSWLAVPISFLQAYEWEESGVTTLAIDLCETEDTEISPEKSGSRPGRSVNLYNLSLKLQAFQNDIIV